MMPVALFMLLLGAAAMAWPYLSGGDGRSDVKRRLKIGADIAPATTVARPAKNANPVREKAVRTAQEFYAKSDPENVARLRMKLIQAGYMDPSAIGTFFLVRFGGFVAFALAAFLADWWRGGDASTTTRWAFIIMAGGTGYFAPGLVLLRLISTKMREYRNGFPDFMDLRIGLLTCSFSLQKWFRDATTEIVSNPNLKDGPRTGHTRVEGTSCFARDGRE